MFSDCSVNFTTTRLNMNKQHATFLYVCSLFFTKMFSEFDQGLSVGGGGV